MSFKEDQEVKLRALLNDPRTGLRDSSDTNKTRYAILGMFEDTLDEYKAKVMDILTNEITAWDGNSAESYSKLVIKQIKDL